MTENKNYQSFDFLVLSAHGAAEHAIFRYLELHPDIFVIAYPESDGPIDDSITASYITPVKNLWGDSIRTGWVFPDMGRLQANLETAREIVRFVKRDLLIQLVRDPVRLLLSLFNNTMKFYSRDKPPPFDTKEFFGQHIHTALYYRAGSHLAAHFDRWEVIDTTDISGDRTAGTLEKIFGLLKVSANDTALNHPALSTPQNDRVQSLLRIFEFTLKFPLGSIRCMFQMEGGLDFNGSRAPRAFGPDKRYETIGGTIDSIPPEIQAALKVSSLKVMVETSDWLAMHPKIRRLIIRDNLLGKAAVMLAMPKLMDQLSPRTTRRITVDDLDKDLIDWVKAKIALDARALFLKEPSLREKWDICGDV